MRSKMNKLNRNDPCPCGSGYKYKKCLQAAKQKSSLKGKAQVISAAKDPVKISRVMSAMNSLSGLNFPKSDAKIDAKKPSSLAQRIKKPQ